MGIRLCTCSHQEDDHNMIEPEGNMADSVPKGHHKKIDTFEDSNPIDSVRDSDIYTKQLLKELKQIKPNSEKVNLLVNEILKIHTNDCPNIKMSNE